MLDHDNYILDLEYANANVDDPAVTLLYSARAAYGMPDLSPASWDALLAQLSEPQTNSTNTLFMDFYR